MCQKVGLDTHAQGAVHALEYFETEMAVNMPPDEALHSAFETTASNEATPDPIRPIHVFRYQELIDAQLDTVYFTVVHLGKRIMV